MNRTERIKIFVSEIRKWYAVHKRELPWRDLWHLSEEERAYRVLVSEIMLQQTQVSRVKIVFRNFIEQFPTIDHLARASNRDVLMAWRGMGYNARALRLRDAAIAVAGYKLALGSEAWARGEAISGKHQCFPHTMDALQALPGVGHYTAAAIRNFAFNIPTPCLDTNIRRILHRTFIGPENSDGTWRKDNTYLLNLASMVLEAALLSQEYRNSKFEIRKFSAADWHAALMDFGSLVQTKTNPKWHLCPLTRGGIMKAAYRVPEIKRYKKQTKEPGRSVGSRHIPNRIFRGKIVEELRDEPGGLTLCEIGQRVCIDWTPSEHGAWLAGLVEKLKTDHLLMQKEGRYLLAE